MSHFSLLVIHNKKDKIDDLLYPYWELDLELKDLRKDPRAEFSIEKSGDGLTCVEFAELEKEYHYNPGLRAFGYYRNPNAKWDWYEIGGRWSNSLLKKDGTWCNSCQKKDIDFVKLNENLIKEAKSRWEESLSDSNKDKGYIYMKYGIKEDDTLESYLAQNKFNTFAVLNKDGWHERGEMGWFGCVSRERKYNEWIDEFYHLIKKAGNLNTFTIVDCHI